ncbi:MAG: biotin transporter BioY [Pseudomonadota bacterium]
MGTARTLHEVLVPVRGEMAVRLRQLLVLAVGVAALALAAKVSVPMWPSPVPITLGTLAVLSIGAAYGPGLGLATILVYMFIGALGFDVFAGTGGEVNGLAYMLGGTGGYLLGYVLAVLALGWAARAGWDRSVVRMAVAMLVGNALIYVPGLLWLHQMTTGWAQTLDWGLTPYLIGDALKLGLAALLFPAIWQLVKRASR